MALAEIRGRVRFYTFKSKRLDQAQRRRVTRVHFRSDAFAPKTAMQIRIDFANRLSGVALSLKRGKDCVSNVSDVRFTDCGLHRADWRTARPKAANPVQPNFVRVRRTALPSLVQAPQVIDRCRTQSRKIRPHAFVVDQRP